MHCTIPFLLDHTADARPACISVVLHFVVVVTVLWCHRLRLRNAAAVHAYVCSICVIMCG